MSPRIVYLLIMIPYIVIAGVYIFSIAPAKEEAFRAYQKAVEAARYFGEADFELIHFKDNDGGVFVFVQKRKETRYMKISEWQKDFKNSYKSADKFAKTVCSVFPVHVPRSIDTRSFEQFKRDTQDGIDDYFGSLDRMR